MVVSQDHIHDVGLAAEQVVEARTEDDARVAVPGCTAQWHAHGAMWRGCDIAPRGDGGHSRGSSTTSAARCGLLCLAGAPCAEVPGGCERRSTIVAATTIIASSMGPYTSTRRSEASICSLRLEDSPASCDMEANEVALLSALNGSRASAPCTTTTTPGAGAAPQRARAGKRARG